jgi:excisionase family DNA binding protein
MSASTRVDIMESKSEQKLDRFGWPVNDWADATGVSRASVYNLLAQNKIESVKFGGKRLITTHPKDFLESLKEVA